VLLYNVYEYVVNEKEENYSQSFSVFVYSKETIKKSNGTDIPNTSLKT